MSWDRISTILSLGLIAALLGWFWIRGEKFIAANGPTFDEGVHLTAGVSYWKTGRFRMNADHPPLLKLLWAIPCLGNKGPVLVDRTDQEINQWEVADHWLSGSGDSRRPLIQAARRINLLMGCCLISLVAWWAYRIWHSKLAVVAVSVFAATDPTLLSLSCILSTDLGLAFFGLLSCYLMWEYVARPSRGLLIATGISLGLMLSTKFSAVGIVAGLAGSGLLSLCRGGRLALPGIEIPGFRPALGLAIRLSVIAIVALAATYAFIDFDQWGRGLKFQLTRSEHGHGVMYLNGELSSRGWYYYFLEALLLKLPLGLLLAATSSVMARLSSARSVLPHSRQIVSPTRERGPTTLPSVEGTRSRLERTTQTARNVWLIGPPLVFFALASYSRVNLGVRVVLPVLPFLYLLAGGLATVECCRYLKFALLIGCVGWCGTVARVANPHELTYLNELAGSCSKSEPLLLDSNLDWGQGLPALKEWMDKNGVDCVCLAFFGTDRPESYGICYQRLPGYGQLVGKHRKCVPSTGSKQIVAVSTNLIHGLYLNDPSLYAFLRQHKPLTVLDGSIRVFDLSNDPEASSKMTALTAQ